MQPLSALPSSAWCWELQVRSSKARAYVPTREVNGWRLQAKTRKMEKAFG